MDGTVFVEFVPRRKIRDVDVDMGLRSGTLVGGRWSLALNLRELSMSLLNQTEF